jgi:hypothetical protein
MSVAASTAPIASARLSPVGSRQIMLYRDFVRAIFLGA